jgi:hypothetical protein
VSITLIHQETISLAIRNQTFRHPVEGRLIFRDISPVFTRTKRVNLSQATVQQVHSSAEFKALAVQERSQKYLPNNSKYKRHKTMTVTSIIILWLADSELVFWVECNISSSAFSRSGYDALLSRMHLRLRSRV